MLVPFCVADRHAGPDGPLSEEERKRFMPAEMWAVTGREWSFGLSHALSCVLLWASLSSNQVRKVFGFDAARAACMVSAARPWPVRSVALGICVSCVSV